MNQYPGYPENFKTVSVTDTSYYELPCPSTTTGTVHVTATSSLAFALYGRMAGVNSNTSAAVSTDWFPLACTNQAGTAYAAGVTITPTAGDKFEFDTAGCTYYAIKPSAGTGTVKMLAKGIGGTGSGAGGGGGASGSSSAFSVFGETGVASGASPSMADETVATGVTATAFNTVASFSAYQGRSGVFVTNYDAAANLFAIFCSTSSTPTVSSTAHTDVVPPGITKFFPVSYLVRIRLASDSAGTVSYRVTEAY